MTVADALLLALGVIAVGSGALVVTSAHLVRAGLFLVISLGAVAGLYLVLGAELVAWVQVLVYVGAVVVLLLFAVMLTRAPIGPSDDLDRPAWPAALVGAGVGSGLTVLLADAFRWTEFPAAVPGTAEVMGQEIFGGWVLPFEVISILLLAALVGAIVLSREDIGARHDPEPELAQEIEPTGPELTPGQPAVPITEHRPEPSDQPAAEPAIQPAATTPAPQPAATTPSANPAATKPAATTAEAG
jgi:NADH:ubiquinone oxidoreductase subunit 6 (subunit J)